MTWGVCIQQADPYDIPVGQELHTTAAEPPFRTEGQTRRRRRRGGGRLIKPAWDVDPEPTGAPDTAAEPSSVYSRRRITN